jgi:hypothetical protein
MTSYNSGSKLSLKCDAEFLSGLDNGYVYIKYGIIGLNLEKMDQGSENMCWGSCLLCGE